MKVKHMSDGMKLEIKNEELDLEKFLPLVQDLEETLVELFVWIPQNFDEQDALNIWKGLENFRRIKRMTVAGTELTVLSVQAFANIIEKNPIQELTWNNNSLNSPGIEALAEAFKENATIKKINLGANGFQGNGLKKLLEILENKNLECLYLNENICTEHGKNIAKFLENNKTIQVLDLYNAGLHKIDVSQIENVAKNHVSLKTLNLKNNFSFTPGELLSLPWDKRNSASEPMEPFDFKQESYKVS